MSTQFIFGGKVIKQPGTYAQTLSGIQNPALALSYGNVLIIDTGSGAGFGSGAGIAGTLASAKDAVYAFDNINDFRSRVKGGLWWRLAEPLFRPAGSGINGISRAYVVKAAATVPAELSYTFTGGGSAGGAFTLQVKDEGLVGNGIEGNATKAVGSFTVATVVTGDIFAVKVNEGAGLITLGSRTVTGIDTPTTVAAALATAINAESHKYAASSVAGLVTVTARNPQALEGCSDWNTMPLTVAITGTSTTSGLASFAGGVDGTLLTQGFGATMEAGTVDTAKFVLKFWVGGFTGLDSDSDPYSGVSAVNSAPVLLAKSPEFANVADLFVWLNANATLGQFFKVKTTTTTGTGVVTTADLTANAGNNKAFGGTETYNSTHLQTVLDNIADLDFTFILSDQGGASAMSADNATILSHIVTEARYEKFLVIAGGDDADTFTSQSIAAAKYWDNDRVVVVHGGPLVASTLSPTGFKKYAANYKAAGVLGRICGLEPQIPGTFKHLKIDGERHQLNSKDVDIALAAGLLVTRFDTELTNFVIVQSINTLQQNEFLVNEDGTSHDIGIKRIAAQLNKEIVINAKKQLLGAENGPNRNTLSAVVVASWLSAYLDRRTADVSTDNLILGHQDIIVTEQGDAIFISYGFIPNGPVNKLFFTGFILN
jgi:hypothetical protein